MIAPRLALSADIDDLFRIRAAVRENRLHDPGSVTREDCDWFVQRRRVWVAEIDGRVAGFSASDPRDATIWALFVDPDFEGRGLGSMLLAQACADLVADGHRRASLTTDPGTRAARLYRHLGWEEQGLTGDGEMGFARGL